MFCLFFLDIFMFVNNYSFQLSQSQFESIALSQTLSINFTVPKNARRDTHKTQRSPFSQLESAKNFEKSSCPIGNPSKTKNANKKFEVFLTNVSGNSHSAENPLEAFIVTKVPSEN